MHPDAQRLRQETDRGSNNTKKNRSITGKPRKAGNCRCAAVIGETKESAGLEEFRRLDKNPPDIVISLDRTGSGWRLFRYDGTPVNFTLIADSPDIAFAHKNGFMAQNQRASAFRCVDYAGK